MTSPESPASPIERFDFAFDHIFELVARPLGIGPDSAWVEVGEGVLSVRFGRWVVQTDLDNVESAVLTGPYSLPKVIGPPHLSFRDRGITFATNAQRGVCIHFREPVRGFEPTGRFHAPALTVTVEDAEGLVAAFVEAVGPGQSDRRDELTGMTTRQLRARAKSHGLSFASNLHKAELIDLLVAEDLQSDRPAS